MEVHIKIQEQHRDSFETAYLSLDVTIKARSIEWYLMEKNLLQSIIYGRNEMRTMVSLGFMFRAKTCFLASYSISKYRGRKCFVGACAFWILSLFRIKVSNSRL